MSHSEEWEKIRRASASGMTQRQIAASLECSTGLVAKVLQREKLGEFEPRQPIPTPSKFQEKHRTLLAALVKYEQEHHIANRTAQQMFSQFSHQCEVIFGEECSIKLNTFSKYLKKIHKFSKHKVPRVDPRKFTTLNGVQYNNLLQFKEQMKSTGGSINIMFLDEAAVSVSDTGAVTLYSPAANKTFALGYRRSQTNETFTVTAVTRIPDPLCYWIKRGTSNGEHYQDFFQNVVTAEKLIDKIVMADNASFHFHGHSGEFVEAYITMIGSHYVSLPAYSPEFNPIELVWRWMKDRLHSEDLDTGVFDAINRVLGRITNMVVLECYRSCGWLL